MRDDDCPDLVELKRYNAVAALMERVRAKPEHMALHRLSFEHGAMGDTAYSLLQGHCWTCVEPLHACRCEFRRKAP